MRKNKKSFKNRSIGDKNKSINETNVVLKYVAFIHDLVFHSACKSVFLFLLLSTTCKFSYIYIYIYLKVVHSLRVVNYLIIFAFFFSPSFFYYFKQRLQLFIYLKQKFKVIVEIVGDFSFYFIYFILFQIVIALIFLYIKRIELIKLLMTCYFLFLFTFLNIFLMQKKSHSPSLVCPRSFCIANPIQSQYFFFLSILLYCDQVKRSLTLSMNKY